MSIVIEKQVDLKPYNTFQVQATASFLARIKSLNDLHELMKQSVFKENRRFILGGGSNVVFLRDFNGLVIKSEENNISVVTENDHEVYVNATSGVVWNDLVQYCLKQNWGGIENLSLIPGTVGAAPIQNIGAYGIELKDVVHQVNGIHLDTGENMQFNNHDCQFSYRESIFKHTLKEKIFISSVTLRLSKNNHIVNEQYEALTKYLSQQNITTPTIQDIAKAVIAIRQSKLPDPKVLGNAGSFFKNPVISQNHLHLLQKEYPAIPFYPSDNENVKIPAGWLIESCGWKGKQLNHVGVHKQQALVIVNYGNADGEEIFQLSEQICNDVQSKFGITLSREVNMIA